jgi:hypothetical protein
LISVSLPEPSRSLCRGVNVGEVPDFLNAEDQACLDRFNASRKVSRPSLILPLILHNLIGGPKNRPKVSRERTLIRCIEIVTNKNLYHDTPREEQEMPGIDAFSLFTDSDGRMMGPWKQAKQ